MPRGGARRRKSLNINALLVMPARKKLRLAREFFLDTHSERGLASGLANASFDCASKRSRVDGHDDFAHVS